MLCLSKHGQFNHILSDIYCHCTPLAICNTNVGVAYACIFFVNHLTLYNYRNDQNIDLSAEKSVDLQSNKKNVDGGESLDVLRIISFSKIDSVEMNILQNFRKHNDKCTQHKPKTRIQTFSVSIDTSVDEITDISPTNIELETQSPRQDQNKRQERDGDELKDTSAKSAINSDVKTISLDKKESFADLVEGEMTTWSSPPSSKYNRDELIAEPSLPCNCKVKYF